MGRTNPYASTSPIWACTGIIVYSTIKVRERSISPQTVPNTDATSFVSSLVHRRYGLEAGATEVQVWACGR